MNFYRLRFINTLFLFIIGILTGFYISFKNSFFKEILNVFSYSNYKPVYYGKIVKSNSYTPVYIKKNLESSDKGSLSSDFSIEEKTPQERKFVENLTSQNPMDDEYDFDIVSSSDSNASVETSDISQFVKDPSLFVNKRISGKAVLLKGDKKPVRLYFLYSKDNQIFYIEIDDSDKIIKNFDDYKIGYYYNIVFISYEGDIRNSNKLISIEPSGEKTSWASGLCAF